MPQILRIGSYIVYFWSNEGNHLEPIHVHISEGKPSVDATKVWITSSGKTVLCNNNSNIPEVTLHRIMRVLEANSDEIIRLWIEYFEEISFFC